MGQSKRISTTGFAMEIWPAAVDGSASEWRGKVRHLATGESGYFRDWSGLVSFIEMSMRDVSEASDGGHEAAK